MGETSYTRGAGGARESVGSAEARVRPSPRPSSALAARARATGNIGFIVRKGRPGKKNAHSTKPKRGLFNGQKSPYQLMTRFGSEELVRYEGSLNRSSAWACEAVAGVERAIRALLSPPRRPCTARTAFNLATTRRCCVAVRAIVKPYVLGRTRKTLGSTRTFWAGTLVSLRMCHIRR